MRTWPRRARDCAPAADSIRLDWCFAAISRGVQQRAGSPMARAHRSQRASASNPPAPAPAPPTPAARERAVTADRAARTSPPCRHQPATRAADPPPPRRAINSRAFRDRSRRPARRAEPPQTAQVRRKRTGHNREPKASSKEAPARTASPVAETPPGTAVDAELGELAVE